MKSLVETLLVVVEIHLAAGMLFAIWFHWIGLKRLDAGSQGAGWGFRLIITPGVVALWPLLAMKMRRLGLGLDPHGSPEAPVRPERLRRWHGLAFKLLVVVIPLVVGAALWFRPANRPPPSSLPGLRSLER